MIKKIIIVVCLFMLILPIRINGEDKLDDKISLLFGKWKIIDYYCLAKVCEYHEEELGKGKVIEISHNNLINSPYRFMQDNIAILYGVISKLSDLNENGTIDPTPSKYYKGFERNYQDYQIILNKYSDNPERKMIFRYILYSPDRVSGLIDNITFEVLTENKYLLMNNEYILERVK